MAARLFSWQTVVITRLQTPEPFSFSSYRGNGYTSTFRFAPLTSRPMRYTIGGNLLIIKLNVSMVMFGSIERSEPSERIFHDLTRVLCWSTGIKMEAWYAFRVVERRDHNNNSIYEPKEGVLEADGKYVWRLDNLEEDWIFQLFSRVLDSIPLQTFFWRFDHESYAMIPQRKAAVRKRVLFQRMME